MVKKKLSRSKNEKEEVEKVNQEQVKKVKEKDSEELPPFPPPRKGDLSGLTNSEEVEEEEVEEEGEFEAVDIEELCRDFSNVPFEIAHILNPKIKPLSQKEKKLIGKPLSRVIVKHDLQRLAKDEIVLVIFLGFAILARVKDLKKDEEEVEKK